MKLAFSRKPLSIAAHPLAGPIALLLWVLLIWGGGYALRSYWEPDEARFVYIAREMASSGNWLVPHRHGIPYADKPPLMFWLINVGEMVFPTPFGSRLPSLLGVFMSLAAAYGIARMWSGRITALRSVLILTATWQFWDTCGMGQIDSLLLGLQMSGLYLLFRNDIATGARSFPWLAFVFLGLAVLAKGPVGLLVPLGAYIFTKAVEWRTSPRLSWIKLLAGLLLAAAIPLAWVAGCYLADAPESYLKELLFTQNVSRAAGALGHRRSAFYYVYNLPISFLPWTLLIPIAYASLRKRNPSLLRRTLAWALFVVVFFSIPASKRNLYILLALPALAIGTAAGWSAVGKSKWAWRIATAFFSVAAVAFALLASTVAMRNSLAFIRNNETAAFIFAHIHILTMLIMFLVSVASLYYAIKLRRTDWATAFVISICIAFACVGTFLLPSFNDMKSPLEVVPLAQKYIPPTGRILLYDLFGESLALHSGRMGMRCNDDEAMNAAMRAQGEGLAIFGRKESHDLRGRFPSITETGEFRMGWKKYYWAAFKAKP